MRNFIKKTLSWMLAMSMAVLPSVAASAVDEEQPTSKLQNFYYALKHKDKVNVAYLGGSVTVGVGSSDYETASWRAQVGNWLKSEYGDKVNNINAAIGATGSYFGSYRANQDTQLDGPNVPDLLFIEFAINDIYDLRTAKQIDVDYESIILQAYKANPKINIITVFTMDIDIANNIINTGKENSVPFTEQRAVAAHYGLPQINVGQALISVIKSEYEKEGKTFSVSDSTDKSSIWHKYITDSCHPGDAGYKVYADTVLDYLKAQLQGNSVTRSESVYNDIVLPTTYASKVGMESHLKRNGHYINFSDAKFDESQLNGWKLNDEGEIVTQYNNASFAFIFKGTAVGFNNWGSPISGSVAYTITATNDSSVKYTGTVSLKKNYSPGLPFPAELKTGLADREWKVECIIKDGGYGDVAYLRQIYIDGDVSSIKQAAAPETEISDLPSKYMSDEFDITKLNDSNNDAGTGKLVTNVNFEGRSNAVSVSKGSATSETVTLNGENEISNIDISNKRYMIIDYYYTGASAAQMKWQYTVADSSVIEKSSELVAGKWSTAVIPLTEDGFNNGITKYKFMPFGDKTQASAGDVLYISGIRFAYESPTVVTENGKAYVQANCYIKGVGAKIYRTLSAAIAALGTNGGTVYVSGDIVAETADKVEVSGAPRGLVTVTGYGKDIAERQGNAIILSSEASSMVDWNGDVNFEAIKLTCSNGLYAGDAKITLSNTVKYPDKLSLGLQWINYSKNNKKSTVVSNGTIINNVAALNSYFGKDSLEFPIKGSVDYTFNNYGSYAWVFSGSGGDSFGNLIMDGDVDYTFNGGTFYNTWVGNKRNGGVKGNTIWRINGGWFGSGLSNAEYIHSGNIFFANYNDGRRNSDRAAYMGNTALIVNSVDFRNYYTGKKNRVYMTLGNGFEIDKTGGESITYNTGYKGEAKLGYIPEFMIVVNNAELGIAFIDKSLTDEYIDYKLKVFGGKAEPVFGGENGRTLLGFTLTGDESGKTPYISGVKLEKVEGKDYYDLSAYKNTGIINVSFVPGLEADVNNDSAFDIRDLVHAKKVFASTDSYNEESINRAYFLGDTKGSAANLAGIRKLLLIY